MTATISAATSTPKTGNLKAVMAVMGHKDVKTAMRYQHPDLESARATLNDRTAAPAGAQATAVLRHRSTVLRKSNL